MAEFEKLSASDLNMKVVTILKEGDSDKLEKLGELGLTYLEEVVLDKGIARRVLPPIDVTPEHNQVVRSASHDGLSFLIDISKKHAAVKLSFGSRPKAEWLRGERASADFFNIATPIFTVNEDKLIALYMPLSKIIENNVASYIEAVEDEVFFTYAQAIITADANKLVAGAAPITRTWIAQLLGNVTARQVKPATCVMSYRTYYALCGMDATQLGEALASQVFEQGYVKDTLMGVTFVLTLKEDLISYNHAWVFTDQPHLGAFARLNESRFFVQAHLDVIEMMAKETITIGLPITNGVAKLELS